MYANKFTVYVERRRVSRWHQTLGLHLKAHISRKLTLIDLFRQPKQTFCRIHRAPRRLCDPFLLAHAVLYFIKSFVSATISSLSGRGLNGGRNPRMKLRHVNVRMHWRWRDKSHRMLSDLATSCNPTRNEDRMQIRLPPRIRVCNLCIKLIEIFMNLCM